MNRRDTVVVFRQMLLMVCGFVVGLSVAVVKTNSQIAKVMPNSAVREVLLFASPFLILGVMSFGLANRSFSTRNLLSEWALIAVAYLVFLLVVLPVTFPRHMLECKAWGWFCMNQSLGPNFIYDLPVAILIFVLGRWLWSREIKRSA